MGNMRKLGRAQWDCQQIRALRQHLGLTQTELAGRLGVGAAAVRRWARQGLIPAIHLPTGRLGFDEDLTHDEREILLAGSLINFYKLFPNRE